MLALAILAVLTTAVAFGIAGFLAGAFAIFKVGEWQKEVEEKDNGH